MDDKNSTDQKHNCSGCQGISWWATLVVAVLAVPSLGTVVALLSGAKGLFGISIFIVTCWACTYLGMRLMHNPKMSEKMDFKKK